MSHRNQPHSDPAPRRPQGGSADEANRGLVPAESITNDPNPAHGTHKPDTQPPRGAGDGELMEQPASTPEARQPGPVEP